MFIYCRKPVDRCRRSQANLAAAKPRVQPAHYQLRPHCAALSLSALSGPSKARWLTWHGTQPVDSAPIT